MPPERRRILLVEDDALFASIEQQALEAHGFFVDHAADGEAGWSEAEQELPDAIVLDIGLPKLDGFALLERLKGDQKTAHVPVIMFSRLGTKEDVARCMGLGASAYLMKTHHGPEDLCQCLRSMFGSQ